MFDYLLPSARFDIGSFLEIFVSEMSIFVNFDLDLQFQCYLLQEIDD